MLWKKMKNMDFSQSSYFQPFTFSFVLLRDNRWLGSDLGRSSPLRADYHSAI
jgi:hypothetical protein